MKRRTLLSATPGLLLGTPALAQIRVDISGVGASQLPIAIASFRDESKAPQQVSAIVRADLERSGVFRAVDTTGVLLDEGSRPDFGAWRGKGVDSLLAGSVTRLADGSYDVRYKLWDAVRGAELDGKSYPVDAGDLRLAAHRIADTVFEKLTGDKGVFSTRIAYTSRTGGRANTRHTLYVADADGENAQAALGGSQPIISPSWSPDGRSLAYVSFEKGKAIVFVQNTSTGARREIAAFRGSNSAPAFSPDGSRIAVTLTRDGNSQLYVMGADGGGLKRVSYSSGIDTEAAWSSDGASIFFVSDRGGGPQIYRMGAAGGETPQRITFSGSYNISPAPSPDGRWLAYITRQSDAFRVALLELSSGQVRILSDARDDESPSFAPNSKLILYASRQGGRDVLMTTSLDGRKTRLGSGNLLDVREPAWGPWGR